ncbi:MAG: hypothetical protein IPL33_20100 [Sphingobacteriales bacterium]|nr:hypothetical protein [Sphingobacteriales bacterium]
MMPQERPQAPDFLTQETTTLRWGKIENQEKWGLQYQAKLNHPNKKNDFQWATYQGKRVNSLLAPLLRKITNNHCSFCDIFLCNKVAGRLSTLDPKSNFHYSLMFGKIYFTAVTDVKKKAKDSMALYSKQTK